MCVELQLSWLPQYMKTPAPSVLEQSSSAPQRKEKPNEEITSDLNGGTAVLAVPGREADKRRVLGEVWTRAVDGLSPSW